MFIGAALLPSSLAIAAWLALAMVCGWACLRADWRALRQVPLRQHLLFGSIAYCLVLWLMSVRMADGLWLHLLGMTTLTLLLGWRFAVIAGSVALCAYALLIGESLWGVGAAWLPTVLVPATVSRALVYGLRRLRSGNLFIYMLGAGFGGGMLAMAGAAVTGLLILQLAGQGAWVSEALASWPLLTLFLFPEGFINGMVVTTLTVFYPQWVKTFDEAHYLDGDSG